MFAWWRSKHGHAADDVLSGGSEPAAAAWPWHPKFCCAGRSVRKQQYNESRSKSTNHPERSMSTLPQDFPELAPTTASRARTSPPVPRLGEEPPIFCEKCGYRLHGLPPVRCEHCDILQFQCP